MVNRERLTMNVEWLVINDYSIMIMKKLIYLMLCIFATSLVSCEQKKDTLSDRWEDLVDKVDVMVADGFAGNLMLKGMEGFASFMIGTMKKSFMEICSRSLQKRIALLLRRLTFQAQL